MLSFPPVIFTVGQETFLEGFSPVEALDFGVVFEDNTETGYLYAIRRSDNGIAILDALHIYNVNDVVDKAKPCELKFIWTSDGFKGALLINEYCHAVFDFEAKAGYNRNAFPETNNRWTKVKERQLTENLIAKILKKNSYCQ